jgi:6-phosphogluconolactonase
MSDRTAAVYVQTNEPETNRVVAFMRSADGSLTPSGEFPTGGAGDGIPHLTSQGSLMLTSDRRHLIVTNAGSDDVSIFAVVDGALELLAVVPTGLAPKSAAEHAGLVYVLNAGGPSLVGFRLRDGRLEPIEGSEVALAPEADPAQVGFGPDGTILVVTDRGTDSILTFRVGDDGLLGEPLVRSSSGPTPYGFAFTSDGTLVVTEAFGAEEGKAAASSYRLENGMVWPVTRSLHNGRSEICWAVITADGRYVFTTNFADSAVSRYAIAADGSITLEDAVAAVAVEGETGLRDEDLTSDGRFLYALDADSRRIFGWSVAPTGDLIPVGSWEGVPATVAGLAAS